MSAAVSSAAKEQAYKTIADVIEDVSGVGINDLTPETNLLDLGLDSLMFVRIGRVLENTYSVSISMKTFYDELAVLSNLSSYLAEHGAVAESDVAAGALQSPPSAELVQAAPTALAVTTQPLQTTMPSTVNQPFVQQSQQPSVPPGVQPLVQPVRQQAHYQASYTAQDTVIHDVMSAHLKLMKTYLSGVSTPTTNSVEVRESSDRSALEKQNTPDATRRPMRDNDAAHQDAMEIRAKFSGIELTPETLSEQQRNFVRELSARLSDRCPSSKAQAESGREYLADWKYSLQFKTDLKEMRFPIVCDTANGAHFTDIDGNDYVDITMGMGVHYFGHSPEFINDAVRKQIDRSSSVGPQADKATEVARKICEMTGHDRAALFVTGSDAVMLALRLVRAARRRNKVVIFGGAYHGICSDVLAAQGEHGSIVMSPGIPPQVVEDIVVLDYDSPDSLARIREMADELAAVMVEPVQSRNPALQPQRFLRQLRALCTETGIPLVFDEMVNGFRQAPGGMQEWFGVKSDMSTFGKIIGGGYPLSVVSGNAELMQWIDGGQWQYGDDSAPLTDSISTGGTHNKHPIALAAADAVLDHLNANPGLAGEVRARMHRLADRINVYFENDAVPLRLTYCGTQFKFENFASGFEYELFFYLLTERGIYSWELHVANLSTAHTDEDCDVLVAAIKSSIAEMRANGFDFRAANLRGQYFPMSSVQKRIYAVTQRKGAEKPYHLCGAWRLSGKVDFRRLEDCFHQVILRHESLRTAFVVVDGNFYQRIVKEPRFSLHQFDLAGRSPAEALDEFTTPFDLLEPPLLRAALAFDSDYVPHLLIDVHHIAADGLSMNIVLQEVLRLYDGEGLTPARVQSRHVQEMVDAFVLSDLGAASRRFWHALIAPMLADPLAYPTDRERPALSSFTGQRLTSRLDPLATKALHGFAAKSRASSFGVLLAVFSLWVYRYARQEKFLIGLPAAGRPGTDADSSVGMFVNTMLFPAAIDNQASVAELLRTTRDQLFAVQEHSDYPFSSLLEDLAVRPMPNRNPIFDIMFSYENAGEREIKTNSFIGTTLEQFEGAGMFDISFDLIEAEGEVLINCAFATDLFDDDAMQIKLDQFSVMIENFIADPDRSIGSLIDENGAYAHEFNSGQDQKKTNRGVTQAVSAEEKGTTGYPIDSTATFIDKWRERVAASPSSAALSDQVNVLSASELESRARDAAFSLFNLYGLRSGQRVVVSLDATAELPMIALAIMSMGAVYVPVTHDLPVERVKSVAAQCSARLIVTRRQDLDGFDNRVELISPDALFNSRFPQIRRQELPAPQLSDTAYILFTSGSTGSPKGVEILHSGISNSLQWRACAYDFDANDITLQMPSCGFDASIIDMFTVLVGGGCLAIIDTVTKTSLEAVAQVIQAKNVTNLLLTPSLYALYLARVPEAFEGIRFITLAGEALPPALVRKHFETLPKVALWNEYGPTECSVVTTATKLHSAKEAVTIGKPIDNVRAYVLDDALNQCEIGVWGTLWLAGVNLAKGYVGREDLTDEKFCALASCEEKRAYNTGDIVRLRTDGDFDYRGRADQQVKLHGYRIELEEVEAAIERLDGVRSAVVDIRSTGESTNLYGWIVAAALPDNWQATLLTFLPRTMLPISLEIIESLPLSSSGKLDRRSLPAHKALGAKHSGTVFDASPELAALLEHCAGVLKRPRVLPSDHYFEIGGDSIQAILLVSKLLEAGYSLDLNEIFATPILGELSKKISTRGRNHAAKTLPKASGLLLSPMQSRFFDEVSEGRENFTQALWMTTPDGLSANTLEALLTHWVQQHPELTKAWALGESKQRHSKVSSDLAFQVDETYAAVLSVDEIDEMLALQVRGAIDVENGPLVSAAYLPARGKMLIAAHHLVVDTLSWQSLASELAGLYDDSLAARALRKLPETNSFAQFTQALHSPESVQKAEAEKPLWLAMSNTDLQVALLGKRSKVKASIPKSIEDAVLQRGHKLYRTRSGELLLAAYIEALSVIRQTPRVSLLMESNGRTQSFAAADFSNTVGWMTSAYPISVTMAADREEKTNWPAVIEQVRDTAQCICDQGLGFGILREIAKDKELRSHHLPQIAFNYLGRIVGDKRAPFVILDEAGGLENLASLGLTPGIEFAAYVDADGLQLAIEIDEAFGGEPIARALLQRVRGNLEEIAHLSEASPALVAKTGLSLSSLSDTDSTFENFAPLSPLQTGLVFHAKNAPADLAYLEQVDFVLDGVAIAALANAFQRLIDHHAALRVDFRSAANGDYCQVIHRHVELPIETVDMGSLEPALQVERIAELVEADRLKQFDIGCAPLMRVKLISLDKRESCRVHVVWTHHHLLMDGWCVGLLYDDLLQHYADVVANIAPREPLPFDSCGYFDWLAKKDKAAAANYWREGLKGFNEKTSMPPTGLPAEGSHYVAGQLTKTLSEELVVELKSWAAKNSATLSSALRVIWGTLLSRFSDEEEVVFGTIVSGRPAELAGVQEAIGLFINTLPVRFSLASTITAEQALRTLRDQANKDREFETLPLAEIQKAVGSEALFDHLLVLENYPMDEALRGEGSQGAQLETTAPTISSIRAYETTDYPLSVVAVPKDGLELSFLFDQRVYSREFIGQLGEHIEVLAKAIVRAPSQPLARFNVLTSAQQQWQIEEWNNTGATYPLDATIDSLFTKRAASYPNSIALTHAGKNTSYGELAIAANAIAAGLVEHESFVQGATIAIWLPRGAELIAAMLGVMKAGCSYTVLDPVYPRDRRTHVVGDASVPLILTNQAWEIELSGNDEHCDSGSPLKAMPKDATLDSLPVLLLESCLTTYRNTAAVALSTPDDAAYVIYTSGSTGLPKGCRISHRNVVRLLQNNQFDFDFSADDVWIAAHSFSFDFSVWETFGALLTGARLVIAPNEEVRDISLFTQLVVNEGVSVLNQTPAAFYKFSDISLQRDLELPSLRYVIFGGDKLQPLRLANWVARFPLTAVKLINMYGITETTVHVSYYALEPGDSDGARHGASIIGRPLPETTMWVVDRFDNLQPPNIPGEILVGGSGVSLGYINRPELNAQRFFKFSASDSVPAVRVYRTGDRGCLREHRGIEYLGREDDQVQVRGYRIELAEIERCFLSHQAVQEVAIVTVENDETIELSAYLVGDRSGAPSQWHGYFDKRLPSYMLPARVSWIDAIPLTPNGKVDVKLLAAMNSIEPSPAVSAESRAIALPDELDKEVSLCWQEVIGVSVINTTDNFFSIGGHSLKAVALAELLQGRLGVDFGISEVFEVPIFSEMVGRLRPRVEQNRETEQKGEASRKSDSLALDALVDAVDLDALESLLNQIENGQ